MTAASRTTSLTVNFSTYAEETRCPAGYLPYRQDFSLFAEATDGNGLVLRTPLKRYVFVQSFKVATFNILRGKDRSGESSVDRLAKYLTETNDVDVVVLQEAAEPQVLGIIRSTQLLSDLDRQVRYADNGDLAVLSKFPIIQNVKVTFSQPLDGYDHSWHYVVLDLGGFTAKVANLHLLATSVAQTRSIAEIPYRRQEVDEVMAYMRNPGMPAIIAGDMNAPLYRDSFLSVEFESIYYTPYYKHFCLPPSTGCHVTPDVDVRFNLDQLWVWVGAPGFSFVDSYSAYDVPPGQQPFLSDHRMQVTRLRINE